MKKNNKVEEFMEECGGRLDDLADKLRLIGMAMLADEKADFIGSQEVRGAGLMLLEIYQGVEAVAILLDDSVPWEKFIARMQKAGLKDGSETGKGGVSNDNLVGVSFYHGAATILEEIRQDLDEIEENYKRPAKTEKEE